MFVQSFIISSVLFQIVIASHLGVDLSVLTDTETFKCLRNDYNISYAIIRAYRSIGSIDENAPMSLQAAYESNINHLSAYIFPCIQEAPYSIEHNITCKSADEQVRDILDMFTANNIRFRSALTPNTLQQSNTIELSRLWIDIEDETPSKYYSNEPTINQKFISELRTKLINIILYTIYYILLYTIYLPRIP